MLRHRHSGKNRTWFHGFSSNFIQLIGCLKKQHWATLANLPLGWTTNFEDPTSQAQRWLTPPATENSEAIGGQKSNIQQPRHKLSKSQFCRTGRINFLAVCRAPCVLSSHQNIIKICNNWPKKPQIKNGRKDHVKKESKLQKDATQADPAALSYQITSPSRPESQKMLLN